MPPRVVGLDGGMAMVENNGVTLPVAWQQVNDPNLSAMVADYQSSQQMPERPMFADNTSRRLTPADMRHAAQFGDIPPPPAVSDAAPPAAGIPIADWLRQQQSRGTSPAPQVTPQPSAPAPALQANTETDAAVADVRNQLANARIVPNRVSTRQQAQATAPATGPSARLVVPQPAPEQPRSRRQGRSQPAPTTTQPGGPPQSVYERAQQQIQSARLNPLEKEMLSAQIAPLNAAEDTLRAQQQAEAEQRNGRAAIHVQQMMDMEEAKMRREDRDKRDQELDAELTRRREELTTDNYWKEKGTGSRIVAAIAMGLGAFGSSLTGGPNAAMEIIQSNIDRDIALKREALQKREDTMLRERNRFADDQQWEMAERVRGYEIAAEQVEMLGATARTAQQRQAAVELQSQMRQVVAGTLNQARIANARAAAIRAREQARDAEGWMVYDYGDGNIGRVRRGDQAGIERNVKLLAQLRADDPSADSIPVIPSSLRPNGRGQVPVLRGTDATRLNEQAASTQAVLGGIDNLREIRQRVGNGEIIDRAAVAEAETARRDLLLSIKDAAQLGALDNGMMQFAEDLIRDPTEFSLYDVVGEDPIMSGLNELRSRTLDRANSKFGQLNLEFQDGAAQSRSLMNSVERPATEGR